jgi:hypothetical protein
MPTQGRFGEGNVAVFLAMIIEKDCPLPVPKQRGRAEARAPLPAPHLGTLHFISES